MQRQFTRLDAARKLIDGIIKSIANEEDKRNAYVHLYGVGLMASTLALKRGCDRKTAEMACVAGMLHDLLTFVDTSEDTDDHAHKCAEYARTNVLCKLDCFADDEKQIIYNGIYNHSDKRVTGDPFDEIIKDADAVQHALRNPMEDLFFDAARIKRVIDEVTK